ncbi:hypothetical protein YC2023_005875 [Brassica napus]
MAELRREIADTMTSITLKALILWHICLRKSTYLHAYGPIHALSADVVTSSVAPKNNRQDIRLSSVTSTLVSPRCVDAGSERQHENHQTLSEPECSPYSIAVWDIPQAETVMINLAS